MSEKLNYPIKVFIPLFIALAIFGFVWIDVDVDLKDPWYRAASKIQKSNTIKDKTEKIEMIEEGGQELRELVAKHPYHARVHYLLGYYYVQSQKWDSAITELKIAIEKGKGGIVNQVDLEAQKMLRAPILNRTNKYLNSKQIYKARASNDEGIALSPNEPLFWLQGGMIHEQLGQTDSAMYYYEKSFNFNPNNEDTKKRLVQIYFNYGNHFFAQKQYQVALNFYQKTIKIKPNNPDFNNNVGSALMNLGRAKEAIPYLEKAVKANPKHPNFSRNLQVAKTMLNNEQGK